MKIMQTYTGIHGMAQRVIDDGDTIIYAMTLNSIICWRVHLTGACRSHQGDMAPSQGPCREVVMMRILDTARTPVYGRIMTTQHERAV